MGLANYLDVRKSYPFYGAYHDEWRNELIHLVGVPTLFTTAMSFIHKTGALATINGQEITAAHVTTVVYATSFIKMEPIAGMLYAPVLLGMGYLATTKMQNTKLWVTVHILAWIAQFIGHGFFEKRKPALLDNLGQSIHSAVFFVWLEFLFFLGYKPALRKELKAMVKVQKAKFTS